MAAIGLARLVGIGVVERAVIPTLSWGGGNGAFTASEQFPEVVQANDTTWKAHGHTDDGNRLGLQRPTLQQSRT